MDEAGESPKVVEKSPEVLAKAKIKEINVPGTFAYVTTTDLLPRILKDGIISASFAKKAKRPYEMRWEKQSDPSRVYVAELKGKPGPEEFDSLEKLAIAIGHPEDATSIVVIILKPELGKKIIGSNYDAEIIRYRISPDYFEGIAVGGSWEPASYDYLPQRETITSLTKDRHLIRRLRDQVVEQMQQAFSGQPDRFLPVYDLNGKVLWPPRKTLK